MQVDRGYATSKPGDRRLAEEWEGLLAAAERAARTSRPSASAACSVSNAACPRRAIRWARAVFPQPGGPQNTTLVRHSPSTSRRSSLPGPSRDSCPTNSSKVRGRIRTARGCTRRRAACSCSANSPIQVLYRFRQGPRAWDHRPATLADIGVDEWGIAFRGIRRQWRGGAGGRPGARERVPASRHTCCAPRPVRPAPRRAACPVGPDRPDAVHAVR